ncbi:MerR family transcriptional regulator [Streptomyces sp. TRM68367]|uniref:MerR family transcriptional regulator n=1 Tax=Streptomyces sp. TRM68367 TaxID=2758415 RepID=UPI00165B8F27|nr:MerR family transcriptional regulator [Streptomyces sp. TRM68367]MBC9724706.1 MerR family transcriptional regulator [Streptomyces sp. TRM68367]
MDYDTDGLMSIGAFARRVRLAPSALRFYDDCEVLRPAHVDDGTGYRCYAPEQEARAVLVRRLRETGVPLGEAGVVLDGSPEDARAALREYAGKARESAASAQAVIEEILRELLDCEPRTGAWLGGAELAGAVRQVAPAAAGAAVREEFPALGCVLIEIDHQEVRLVATDRYRLAVRALRPLRVEGEPCRALIDVTELTEAAAWALRRPEVGIEVDGRGARLTGDSGSLPLPAVEEEFPDYQLLLDDLPVIRHRVITDRAALRTVLTAARHSGPVTLHADGQRLDVAFRGAAPTTLTAVRTGAPVRIAFDPDVLLAAVDAGVGPDVLLEISTPDRPVVVRSADQGSFTTLAMPAQDTGAPV